MRTLVWIALFGPTLCLAAGAADARVADAVMNRDAAAVRTLLQQKADVNAAQADGTTALQWAVRHDDMDTADRLLRAGASAKAATRYGVTPLALAATNGNAAMIERLLQAGADANAVNPEGETALMTAARTGVVDAVKVLLSHNANVNAKENTHGQTALMWAALENHPEVVKLLLAKGADINAHSTSTPAPKPAVVWAPNRAAGVGITRLRARPAAGGGFNALLFAARDGNLEMTRFLLDNGAGVNERSANGTTPLLAAIINNHFLVSQYLLDKGADPNLADSYGRPALYAALELRNLEQTRYFAEMPADVAGAPAPLDFIRTLLDRKADPNARTQRTPVRGYQQSEASWVNFDGQTPFIRAALSGDITVMRLLLEHAADPNLKTDEGSSALMAAAGVNYVGNQTFARSPAEYLEAAKLCLEKGNDAKAINSLGLTALHGAANKGADDIIKLLLEHGADIHAKDKEGRTPAAYAEGVFLAIYPPAAKPTSIALIKELTEKAK